MIRWLRRLFALFAVLAASAARAEGPVLMVEDPSILSALEQRADSFCREDYMCQAFPPDTPGPRQGQGHRLLFADLLHLPDAHRQPHHAVVRGQGD